MYRIFDDVFHVADRDYMYSFVRNSLFKVGWADRDEAIPALLRNLYSDYSEEDLLNMKFMETIQSETLVELIDGRKPERIVVNLSQPGNVYYQHSHYGEESLVYYANIRWLHEWAGETIIYKEDGEEVETAIAMKPGRVLWLGEGIPHSLRPPSLACPDFRFTLAMFFKK